MTLIAEICIFLCIVLGIIVLTFSMFGDNRYLKSAYVRDKKDNEKILVEIKYIGLKDKDIQEISRVIAAGNFNNIYDIADEFKVYKKDEP